MSKPDFGIDGPGVVEMEPAVVYGRTYYMYAVRMGKELWEWYDITFARSEKIARSTGWFQIIDEDTYAELSYRLDRREIETKHNADTSVPTLAGGAL